MEYTEEVHRQLIEFIKNPTVLTDKEGVPLEYSSYRRTRYARHIEQDSIPYDLFRFILDYEVEKKHLEEFGSGVFLNFVSTNKTYG